MSRCIGALEPHISAFRLLCLLLAAAAAAAAVSCRLYHAVPQALDLFTLWQPRYNSTRTVNSKLVSITSMRVLALRMRV